MPRKKTSRRKKRNSSKSLGAYMRQPLVQVAILLVAAFVVYILATTGNSGAQPQVAERLPAFVSVDEAYQMYQEGTFVLDVRTPEEWNEYHAPNTTLIPLDELASRVDELPKDQPIVVVCRSGNRSQTGRDILLQAGYNATSMNGGLNLWRDSGYPIVSGP
ncbi:MAG: rhodanese-like domain-containing protein [Anaerolineales bacterium]